MKPTHKILLSIILIAILGFAVYANSFNGEFIWDDEHLVMNNLQIQSFSNLPSVLAGNITTVEPDHGTKFYFYRPLQILTYTIDYYFWKLNVTGYHLTNTLLHIFVALAIFWLITILYNNLLLSLFTAILFVIHPIHTEAVTYISGRADSLSVLFILLCGISYIKYCDSKNTRIIILIIITYVCALLSKEQGLILPILLLLYHYTFKKKIAFRAFIPILILIPAYLFTRLTLYKTLGAQGLLSNTTLWQRIPGFFTALTNYLKLLILPLNLHMEYGSKLFKFTTPASILGLIILLTFLLIAFNRKDKKTLFFPIFWFLITLLPTSNLYPINAYMAEHWLYLPAIGLFLLAAKGLCSLSEHEKFRISRLFIIISLISFYSYLTIKQNHYWQDPLTFYERTLKYSPESEGVLYNLGNTYRKIGETEKAITIHEKLIKLTPNNANAYNNIGIEYRDIGKIDKAEASFKKAIEFDPKLSNAYFNLARIYYETNKIDKAIVLYEQSIALNPNYVKTYNYLAIIYATINQRQKAIPLFKKAIELDPNYSVAYRNLVMAYYEDEQYDAAIKYVDKALEFGLEFPPGVLETLNQYR